MVTPTWQDNDQSQPYTNENNVFGASLMQSRENIEGILKPSFGNVNHFLVASANLLSPNMKLVLQFFLTYHPIA